MAGTPKTIEVGGQVVNIREGAIRTGMTPREYYESIIRQQKRSRLQQESKEVFGKSEADIAREAFTRKAVSEGKFVTQTKGGIIVTEQELTPEQRKILREGGEIKITEAQEEKPSQEKPPGVVTAAEEPSRLERVRRELETKGARGDITPFERAKLFGAVFGAQVITFPKRTFEFGKALVTEPASTIKAIPGGIKKTGTQFFSELESPTPEVALGKLAGEAAILKGTGKIIEVGGRGAGVVSARVSPKFTPVTEEGIKVTTRGGRELDIGVAGRISTIEESVSKQARLAGTKVDAVSGARDFFKVFKREVTIDKPLPSSRSPVLERSLFFDPRARLRPSRLGLETPKANVIDIIAGEVTFRRGKPQALLLPGAEVEAFPRSLRGIESKLLKGKTITSSEARRFLEFQLTPRGKLKPVGFLSREPEVTLPPTEKLIRVSKIGDTLIEERRVPIFETRIAERKLPKASRVKVESLLKKQKISREDLSTLLRDISSPSVSKAFVSPRLASPPATPARFSSFKASPRGVFPRTTPRPIRTTSSIVPTTQGVASPRIASPRIASPRIASPRVSPPLVPRVPVIPMVPVTILGPPKLSRLKKRKPISRGREDIGISEGFIARTLGLKPIKIKKTDIPKIEKGLEKGVALRRAPIVR